MSDLLPDRSQVEADTLTLKAAIEGRGWSHGCAANLVLEGYLYRAWILRGSSHRPFIRPGKTEAEAYRAVFDVATRGER